jgi:hypothetical protein
MIRLIPKSMPIIAPVPLMILVLMAGFAHDSAEASSAYSIVGTGQIKCFDSIN